MTPDLFLTLGLCLAVLTIPMYLSALADSRSPRLSLLSAILAIGCIAYAMSAKPSGYTLQEVPAVVIDVLAGLVK
ncbi:hypothetical protein [Cognatishimia sp.]|uniref:hypothetical protein n=1 Tax=Cognatishimia sp. TaxID=2211648 RepID=UPI0035161A61